MCPVHGEACRGMTLPKAPDECLAKPPVKRLQTERAFSTWELLTARCPASVVRSLINKMRYELVCNGGNLDKARTTIRPSSHGAGDIFVIVMDAPGWGD